MKKYLQIELTPSSPLLLINPVFISISFILLNRQKKIFILFYHQPHSNSSDLFTLFSFDLYYNSSERIQFEIELNSKSFGVTITTADANTLVHFV